MNEIDNKHMLQSKAEQALQEAAGNSSQAAVTLKNWIDSDEDLRAVLVERGIQEEIERAARRLELESKKCPYCSADIPTDALKCRQCGEWLADTPSQTQTLLVGPRIWYFVLFTGWLLILLVAGLIYSLFTS